MKKLQAELESAQAEAKAKDAAMKEIREKMQDLQSVHEKTVQFLISEQVCPVCNP